MSEQELLADLRKRWTPLPDKPDESPETTLDALRKVAGGNEAMLVGLVERRLAGTPLSHLTGIQAFFGMQMIASAEALIPRRETEILARGALEKLKNMGQAVVLDVCCGAGNLGLALAWHQPLCRVWGADLSTDAASLAARNALQLGLQDRVHFEAGDLLAPFDSPEFLGRVDMVICNPPYISSAKVDQMPHEISGFEPRLAFDGGPFGVRILTRLVRETPRFLRLGGWLAFEVGLGQGNAMRKMLENAPAYDLVEALPDRAGETRALLARAAVTTS